MHKRLSPFLAATLVAVVFLAMGAAERLTMMVEPNGTIAKPSNFLSANSIATYDLITASSNAAYNLNQTLYAKKAAGAAGIIFTNAGGYTLTLGPLEAATSNATYTLPGLHGNALLAGSVNSNRLDAATLGMFGAGGLVNGSVNSNKLDSATLAMFGTGSGLTYDISVSGTVTNADPVPIYTNSVAEGRTYLVQLMAVAAGVGSQTNSFEDLIVSRISYASNDVRRVLSTNSFKLLSAQIQGAGATNAVSQLQTNGVTLGTAITNLNFAAGANTTVTGAVAGGSVTIGISAAAGGGVTSAQLESATNSIHTASTNSAKTYADATFATPAQLTAATNGHALLADVNAATNNAAQTWDSELASYLALTETNGLAAGITNQSWAAIQAATNGTVASATSATTATNLPSGTAIQAAIDARQYGTENGTNWAQLQTNVLGSLAYLAQSGTNDFAAGITNLAWTATQASTNGTVAKATSSANATNLYNSNLPVPTNAPVTGNRLIATSASSTAWGFGYLTNANAVRPDFNVPYSELTTNAAFAFLAPTNVSTVMYQACAVLVTNSTAAAVAITAPANTRTSGTWYVTNATIISWFNWSGRLTNAIALPLW